MTKDEQFEQNREGEITEKLNWFIIQNTKLIVHTDINKWLNK